MSRSKQSRSKSIGAGHSNADPQFCITVIYPDAEGDEGAGRNNILDSQGSTVDSIGAMPQKYSPLDYLYAYLEAKEVPVDARAFYATRIERMIAEGREPVLPKKAPELYDKRKARPELARKENIVEFLRRVWGDYMLPGTGPLTRQKLRDFDPKADAAVENWISYHGEIPSDIYLPTIKELNEAIMDAEQLTPRRRPAVNESAMAACRRREPR